MPTQNKQNTLDNIKKRVFGKQKGNNEYNLIDIWHYLMMHYGYIPFEEFKKMDANLVEELLDRLEKLNRTPPKGRNKW